MRSWKLLVGKKKENTGRPWPSSKKKIRLSESKLNEVFVIHKFILSRVLLMLFKNWILE